MTTYSGTFQYTLPTTDYNDTESPFINTDGSFTTLTKTTSVSGLNTIVLWNYVFNDNGTTNDGLYLNGTISTTGNMTIDDFDSIPMSRQGSQFYRYIGYFPSTSTNMPTVLPNTSYMFMFYLAQNFNQDITSWDVSSVDNMYSLFTGTSFNQDITSWDVSSVTDTSFMFNLARFFNQDISRWDVSSVTSMAGMFINTNEFNQNIGNWNTSNVKYFSKIFQNAGKFNNGNTSGLNINSINWDLSSAVEMPSIFLSAISFNSPINFKNADNIKNYNKMLHNCYNFNQNLGNLNLSSVSSNGIENIFNREFEKTLNSISITNYNKTLEGWASQSVNGLTFDANYLYCSSVGEKYINILKEEYEWTVKNNRVVNTSLFQYTLPIADYVESDEPIINNDGENSFRILQKTTELSGSNIIVKIDFTFDDNGRNDGLNLNAITVSKNMSVDYFGAIPLSRAGSCLLNYTGTVPTELPTLLKNTSLSRMFEGATNYNQDISSFDVSTVKDFSAAFKGATSFNQNLGSWDISSATDMSNMLDNTNLSSINYGNTLKGWHEQSRTPLKITLGASNLTYTYSNKIYKDLLISNNDWSINDSGLTTTEYGVTYDNNTLVATSFDSTTLPSSGAINFRPTTISITSSAFLNQTSITSVSIPSAMTSISSNVFKGCSGIKNVVFFSNSSCSTIEDSAFEDCTSLVNIKIPSSVTTINNLSFNNCSSMKYAIMSASGIPYTYSYTSESDQTTAMQNFLSDPSTWSQASVKTTTPVSESDAQITIIQSPVTLTNDTRNAFVNNLFEENAETFSSSVNSFVIDTEDLNIKVSIPEVSSVRAFNAIPGNGINDFVVSEITTTPDIGTYVAMDIGSKIKLNITDPSDNSIHSINIYKENSIESTIYIDDSTSGKKYVEGNTVIILNNSITIGSVSQVQLLSSSINGNFEYTLPTSEYVESDEPIINNDSSFSILEKNVTTSGSNTTVTRNFSFNDNGSTNDGLNLNEITTSTNMSVNDFDYIPLSRAGSSLLNYTGTVPTELPTLLSNSSLSRMFEGATNYNQDVSSFDVSTVKNFSSSFKGATSFNQNLGSWDISSATDMSNMLDNTVLSPINYANTIIGWNELSNIPLNITLGASNLTYDINGRRARQNLIKNLNWTINDDGLSCVHETTDFLCYIDNEEKYINIKDIKEGFLVKTYNEGYVKVKNIFKQKCVNSEKNKIKKFFVMDKSKNNLLTKDLIITGGHSVLLDNLTEEQYNKMKSSKIKNIKVHDKYKLLAFFNEDFVGKTDKSEETVYLLVLEADNDFKVYGVYVNGGMLIESCGIGICKKFGFL